MRPLRLLAPSLALALAAAAAERPNILLVVVDDQTPFELAAYDPETALHTPTLDRLAATGMTIEVARHMGSFAAAVCTPSRHMIMSGRSLWRLPIGPGADTCPPDLAKRTLPAVFRRAGYDTMRTCKRGNSYAAANAEFEVRRQATKRGGTPETGSAWHAERVLEFLDRRGPQAPPFLIYFGFSHPHDVRDGTPELLRKYGATNHRDPDSPPPADPRQPPLPPNWLPGHPFLHGHDDVRDETRVSGVGERRDPATVRNETGREFACAEEIDRQLGRVLERLESLGELDRTHVIYTSDHGIAIGRHGLMGKQNLYEHSWRVPMIARGPGIAPGTRATGNVYLGDLLATLCELAGIDPPATNEGASFAPVLLGERDAVRETMYGVYSGGSKPGIRCVARGPWKLIEYDALDGASRHTQLFHLEDNPHEWLPAHHHPVVRDALGIDPDPSQTNLAADPAHADTLARMRALLFAEMKRLDDPHRLWNQPAD